MYCVVVWHEACSSRRGLAPIKSIREWLTRRGRFPIASCADSTPGHPEGNAPRGAIGYRGRDEMIQGLYAAANGMMAVEDHQAVVANNIANATTFGFKRQIPVQKGFDIVFRGAVSNPAEFNLDRAPGGGAKTIETFTNYGNGVIQNTGNELDVAILGPAFIRIETPAGERYTRNGRLAVGGAGELVTLDGHMVLNAGGGPIDVSGGRPQFDADGTVSVNGAVRGQVALVEFEDPHALTREGYTLFRADEETAREAQPATASSLVGESLEASNVEIPNEMIRLMMALRAYAANQRVMQSIDETASRLIDQVGSPG